MSPVLLFLFVFQSALAFAFTFFIVRIVTKGEPNPMLTKVRIIILPFVFLIPACAYIAFAKSLPDDADPATAFWPAIWILMIMLAMLAGMTFATKRKSPNSTK